MANTSFLDFNTQTSINSGDYVVGYNAAGTGEIRVPINVGLNTSNNTLSIVGSLSASSFLGVSYKTEFNYLAPAGTYVPLFTVPAGYRFACDSITFTIDNVVGTFGAGTAPTISVISGTVYSAAARLQGRIFGSGNHNVGSYFKSANAQPSDDFRTAAAGSTVSVVVQVANAGTSFSVLSGAVIVAGFLY